MRYLTILLLFISTLSFSQEIYIPNAFTPNGDGINDYFGVYCTSVDSIEYFKMEVFNSNGELVFQTLDVNGKWQGGTEYFGTTKPFTYNIEYKVVDRIGPLKRKGFVVILR